MKRVVVTGFILPVALADVVQAKEIKIKPFHVEPCPDGHLKRFPDKDVTNKHPTAT